VQQPAFCQSDTAQINRQRLRGLVAATTVGYVGSLVALNQLWYAQYPRQSFRFFNDAAEWKQVDKVGHLYSSFFISHAAARTLQWANVPARKAAVWGSVAAFAMTSSIEVFDGFSAGYGASATDLSANFLGSALFVTQALVWNEVRIQPKFSFHRTSLASQRPDLLGNGLHEEWLKDYNGQTYWLSFDMDKFTRFPAWLNISLGYGAHDMIRGVPLPTDALTPYRQYYIGIDFDLTAIRTQSKFLKSLLFVANMIRLPAPAIEFSQRGTKLYALYF
jgi:hypothetical protein